MRISNCPEHSVLHKGWTRLLKSPSSAQKIARRAIRTDKKFHGMVHAHEYNYPSHMGGWVSGCARRQLLNKGGKP